MTNGFGDLCMHSTVQTSHSSGCRVYGVTLVGEIQITVQHSLTYYLKYFKIHNLNTDHERSKVASLTLVISIVDVKAGLHKQLNS